MRKSSLNTLIFYITIILIIQLFLIVPGNAAEVFNEKWTNTYGGKYDEVIQSVQQTSDGGYIIAGSTCSGLFEPTDAWIVKTDSNGKEQWSKTFGGEGYDWANSLIKTSDGGFIFAGHYSYEPAKGDAWLVKIDESGNEQWSKTFGSDENDEVFSVQQTSDGGYIVAGKYGELMTEMGSIKAWIIKTDADGNELWSKTFGGEKNEWGYYARETSDGMYILAGSTLSYGSGGTDAWLIKLDTNGNKQWDKTYGGTNRESFRYALETLDGSLILCGSTSSYGAGHADAWLIKTDAYGNQQWSKTFGGEDGDFANSFLQTPDGYLIAGATTLEGEQWGDAWLIKTDLEGNEQWSKTFGGKDDDEAFSLIQTLDEGYIIAARTDSYGSGNSDGWLIKLEGKDINQHNSMLDPTNPEDTLPQSTQTETPAQTITTNEMPTPGFGIFIAILLITLLFLKKRE